MITLKQYAAAMAAIDAGKPLPDVIATFDLDLAGWETAHEHWRGRLQAQVERGEHATVDKYLATYSRQRAVVERELSESETVLSVAVERYSVTGDDDTAPMTPESTTAPLPTTPANRTEPLSAEALTAFQAATNHEPTGLPFKPDEWTLDQYAALEKQIDQHPGAIAAVLASFDIDFAHYVTLRGRFADALKEHQQATRSRITSDAQHRTAKVSGRAGKS